MPNTSITNHTNALYLKAVLSAPKPLNDT